MPTLVKMPKWGLTMTAGTVTDWIRQEGDEVSEGDPLLTVETEKAINDVEAPASGLLRKIVAVSGEEVAVSSLVAVITAPGEELTDDDLDTLLASAALQAAPAAATVGGTAIRKRRQATRDESGRVNASPAARKLAQELGIDLTLIEATGPGGRVTSDDVEHAASTQQGDPSPRTDYVEADGLQLFSIVAGPVSGQRLVFLHGLSGSFSTWQVVMGELADRYRVAAIDLPGHGQSDKPDPATFDYAVPSLAKSIGAALQNANLGPAIVVGHSLGGAVALQLALEYSDTVLGLVLVNSVGLGTEISPELLALMDREPGSATARALLQLFFEDQALVLDRGVDEMAQGQLSEGSWKAQRATAAAAFSSNGQSIGSLNRLSEITSPTLIVWGMKDLVIPVDHAFHAARAIPDATLKLLPAIGHVPQVEAPSAVTHAIDRFARSLSE